MNKISVTRALAELKRLDERIGSAIAAGTYVGVSVGESKRVISPANEQSVTSLTAKIQSSFDRVQSLIANRAKLKSAIVKSNATQTVEVMGRTMTVAEAIELKSQIPLFSTFTQVMSNQYVTATRLIEQENAKVEKMIEDNVKTTLGTEKRQVDAATYSTIADPIRKARTAEVVDPQNVQKKIDENRELANKLKSEIDFTLSESNARTTVEIDFDLN